MAFDPASHAHFHPGFKAVQIISDRPAVDSSTALPSRRGIQFPTPSLEDWSVDHVSYWFLHFYITPAVRIGHLTMRLSLTPLSLLVSLALTLTPLVCWSAALG